MHTVECPHSLLRPVAECLPLATGQKWVQFYLAKDLGKVLSLPTDLANILGEDFTNEQIDAPHPPAP